MEVTKKEVRGESKEIKRPEIDSALIEKLLKDYEQPKDLIGLAESWKSCKRLYERVLEAELAKRRAYADPPHANPPTRFCPAPRRPVSAGN